MDDPLCDKKKLINTVKQFGLLNYLFTGSRKLIKKYIINDIKKSNKNFDCMPELMRRIYDLLTRHD